MKRHLFFLIVLIPLSVIFLLLAMASLRWRMAHDAPTEIYVAFLMDRFGFVPYRDLWEINLPGSFFAYMLIGKLIGYTNDACFRLLDLAYLAVLCGLSAWWLRRLGWKIAWAAPVLFGLAYLQAGPAQSLQREYLLLLPAMLGVIFATKLPRLNNSIRAILVGLMFGLTATVKPHFAIGLPIALMGGYLAIGAQCEGHPPSLRQWLFWLIAAGIGFALPLIAMVAYMVISKGLPYYLDMARNYYPLYANVTRDLQILKGAKHTNYLIKTFLSFGGFGAWLLPATVGLLASFVSGILVPEQKRQIAVIGGLILAYSIYPVFSGQFFVYHLLPFFFFLFMLVALCFAEQKAVNGLNFWLPQVAFLLVLLLHNEFVPDLALQVADHYANHRLAIQPADGRVDEIAKYLKENLHPGDTVQPLDWVAGGVLQGMLEAQARIATPYLTDMQFFHDVSNPYIQELREDFLRRLNASPPRFIVEYKQYPWIGGEDTTSEFLELWLWINMNYKSVYRGQQFEIYERVEPHATSASRKVLMYPPPTVVADWYPDVTNITVTPVQDEQLESDATLDGFVTGYSHITLAFANESKSDPHREMETWASQKLFRIGEHWGYGMRMVDYFACTGNCVAPRLFETTFDDVITLATASMEHVIVGDENWICIHLEWVAETPIDKSYKTSAHVVNQYDVVVAQYDSQPVGYLAPTYTWSLGTTVLDRFAMMLPRSLSPGEYEVRIIIYDEATQERLNTSRTSARTDYVVIGKVKVEIGHR